MKILALSIVAIIYPLLMHFYKDNLNEWVDLNFSHLIGRCQYCRGFHFGSVQGIVYAAIMYYALSV